MTNQKAIVLLPFAFLCLAIGIGALGSDEEKSLRRSSLLAQANADKSSDSKLSVDQESEAIRFVESHHAELANLLVILKNMNRDKYEIAIRDVSKALKRLDATQKRDAKLYSLDLDGWKIQSKIDLLLARGMAGDKDIDRTALKSLVQERIANQRNRIARELELLKEREASLKESLESIDKNSQERAEQQFAALLKKIKNNKAEKSKDNKAPNR